MTSHSDTRTKEQKIMGVQIPSVAPADGSAPGTGIGGLIAPPAGNRSTDPVVYESGDAVRYFPSGGRSVPASVISVSASGKRIYIRILDSEWLGATTIYVKPASLTLRPTP